MESTMASGDNINSDTRHRMTSMGMDEPLDESILQDVYIWIDQIPLTRAKKNFARDFSDGGLVAEVVAHYFPKYVEQHNYPSTTVTNTKIQNWQTLNRKVLRKLDFELAEEVIRDVAQCKPFVIERVLIELRQRIDTVLMERRHQAARNDLPESDQYHHTKWRHNSLDQYGTQLSPINKQQPVYTYNEPQAKASPTTRKVKKFGAQPRQPVVKQPTGVSPTRKPTMNHQQPSPTMKKPSKVVVSTMASSVVPKWEYEAKVQECVDKEETIQLLMHKMQLVEERMHQQDDLIQQLTEANAQLVKKKGTGPKPKAKAKF